MRNDLPLWLDASIVAIAWATVLTRFAVMRSVAHLFTLLIACFALVDTIKFGPMNDWAVGLADERSVRVAAHILCVAAALVAATAAHISRDRHRNHSSWWAANLVLLVAVSVILVVLDQVAGGDRNTSIEEASAGTSVAYFVVYAGAIVLWDLYALVVVLVSLRQGDHERRPSTAISAAAVLLFFTTGVNALTLLWYSFSSWQGKISAAERLQRDSNGNLFAYFTLGLCVIGLVGLASWILRGRQHGPTLTGEWIRVLPTVWEVVTDRAPQVRLPGIAAMPPDTRLVRQITETIEALHFLKLDASRLRADNFEAELLRAKDSEMAPANTAEDVIALARRWNQHDPPSLTPEKEKQQAEPRAVVSAPDLRVGGF